MNQIHVITAISAIFIATISWLIYRSRRIPKTLSPDGKEQRIKLLTHEDVVFWTHQIITSNNYSKFTSLELQILSPSLLTSMISKDDSVFKEMPGVLLKTSPGKCVMLIISNDETVLTTKVVLPQMLSKSMQDVLRADKIYVHKIKT